MNIFAEKVIFFNSSHVSVYDINCFWSDISNIFVLYMYSSHCPKAVSVVPQFYQNCLLKHRLQSY